MAWTTPRTWVTSEVVTASIMNTHVRDNFNETGPAVAATSGALLIVNAANDLAESGTNVAQVSTAETTTSTTYTDLTTSGPAVSPTVSASGRAIVFFSAQLDNDTAGAICLVSYAVSGATTVAANDGVSLLAESGNAGDGYSFGKAIVHTGLNAGTNTFTLKYRVTAGTGTFRRRRVEVIGL